MEGHDDSGTDVERVLVPVFADGGISWMYGPNWPASGEIDIIEGVNLNTHNSITLHTSPGCSPGIGDFGERGNRSVRTFS